tara:strand:+ start:231 stop:953 length:723 start_codon:yes stop_codon:yes gene_type:complete
MKAVISFHAIDTQSGPLSFSPKQFDQLLDALRRSDTPILPLDELLSPEAKGGVALTFDDGIDSVYSSGLPILRNYEAPAHLFLTTAFVAGNNRWPGQPDYARHYNMLNWSQIEKLHASNVAIEAHTATHPDLRQCDEQRTQEEFRASDAEIERKLGRKPRFFAYPYGFFDRRVAEMAAAHYEACVTTELSYLPICVERSMVPRLDSHYLRSTLLMRNLGHPAAVLYISLRAMVRQVLGRT